MDIYVNRPVFDVKIKALRVMNIFLNFRLRLRLQVTKVCT